MKTKINVERFNQTHKILTHEQKILGTLFEEEKKVDELPNQKKSSNARLSE